MRTTGNTHAIERSKNMLAPSIKEMRQLAHNLMPEALVKFGLDTALKDFCNDIKTKWCISSILPINRFGE
jgi:two-component system, NarL family, sensor kinase